MMQGGLSEGMSTDGAAIAAVLARGWIFLCNKCCQRMKRARPLVRARGPRSRPRHPWVHVQGLTGGVDAGCPVHSPAAETDLLATQSREPSSPARCSQRSGVLAGI